MCMFFYYSCFIIFDILYGLKIMANKKNAAITEKIVQTSQNTKHGPKAVLFNCQSPDIFGWSVKVSAYTHGSCYRMK